MTLSLTLTQPGSILISGGATVQASSDTPVVASCVISIPGSGIRSTEADLVGLDAVEGIFQAGQFSGLSAGSYTITWKCAAPGSNGPAPLIHNLSLNAWASQ